VNQIHEVVQMIGSKDLTLIIMFAVLNLVLVGLIGQIPELVTGIPAIGYAFIIFYAITSSVALLMYQGRRWRFLTQSLLFNLLAIFFVRIYTPIAAVVSILTAFIIEAVFNSCHGLFKRKNRLLWWATLSQIYSWTTQPIWTLFFVSIFIVPFEAILRTWFFPIILVSFPMITVEAIAGAYMGHRIFQKLENFSLAT
jgi:hypothetical protein